MIHSFKDRRLEKFFRNGKTTAGIPSEIINAILCRLETLDNVQSERELLSNSLRYERLRMTSNRYSSIRVNSKYRLFFEWNDGAHNVHLSAHDYKLLIH
ncbi:MULTISPECIES: type II toxin-antitoxin system RelE/ParE family toxin [Enterobacteriaceae]|uniref:Toxin-plasmid maintenance system killer protein n=1 Tax=Escherichia coli TaxID=562 RepID=A0A6G4NS11_ECOLX|nr:MULTISPECIES: type II toxin-antitoxin system RelE/ParE family toxin [Enterobacteriaceae]ELD9747939.1 type II toxin-antitoxin system RelE/ParE family toxin [Salmonella enterica]EFC4153602.1 toxin-plasmid maintenance system killer protein [Escherichia coli]EHX2722650.1 type II toxin-antitoxin system RelE/ParE family toxin [Escherichia coli]EHX2797540.1 type II toxin-antitoxin system RelE/ParE family toxin [Escherichia coli]EIZ4500406.1 type II toxin-antitoxin system RelE/ParE family toxin [Es